MYVKLHGGTRSPGGYIVPCRVIRPAGEYWTIVELSNEEGTVKWEQAVRNGQLISDIKVIEDE